MTLTITDWAVIASYFLLNLAIGLYYARRARGSTTEFFLSGRDVPWWLAGTSMVATTFAADTPLVVTGLVARYGIAGNWLWWSMAASGMLTVFVYARLWRRAGVMTDVEFAELRYAGKPAAFLRGFRALYLGIPINCIIIGWVNLAMMKILEVTLGLDPRGALLALVGMLPSRRSTRPSPDCGVSSSPISCSSSSRWEWSSRSPSSPYAPSAASTRSKRRSRLSTPLPEADRGWRFFPRPIPRGCRPSRFSSISA